MWKLDKNQTIQYDLTYSYNSLTYLYLSCNKKGWASLKFGFYISADDFKKFTYFLCLVLLSLKYIEKSPVLMCEVFVKCHLFRSQIWQRGCNAMQDEVGDLVVILKEILTVSETI